MASTEGIAGIVDALQLPADARVESRVPKKLLVEQGAPTSADRRAIQDGIDEIQWFAACKPATIGVPSFTDDTREYLEIAVVGSAFRPGAKTARLIELIHRAIPYPVLLITSDEGGIAMSAAHKRRAQNEAGRTVIDEVVVTAGLPPVPEDAAEIAFRRSLALTQQPRSDLFALYAGWHAAIEALNAARLTGAFPKMFDHGAVERRRSALEAFDRLSREAGQLRAQAARTRAFSQRVELNMKIKNIEKEMAHQRAIIAGGER